MKTIRERADEIATSTVQPYTCSVAINAERVLRELVEEAGHWWRAHRWATPGSSKNEDDADLVAFRRAFLGQPSLEARIVQAICSQPNIRELEIYNHDHQGWCVTKARQVVDVLRTNGLLRESPSGGGSR